ncbi:MAG: glycerol acyltransferase [Bacteroidales bacterium]|nr:glycerol acyltransferase [Bacteroidales bacterium]
MDIQNETEKRDEIKKEFLNIKKIFYNKSPSIAKMVPKLVYNYLKKIIHESELNELIYNNKDKFDFDLINSLLEEFQIKIVVKGLENVSSTGRNIIASNHPLGGFDGLALMSVVGKIRKDIVFPVNDLLMNLPNIKNLFIPINKHGSNAENVIIINDTFASDVMILFFPAGLVSRKQSGKILDLEWKKTFITKAKRFKRDVIPTFIDGRNSNFFYNLANLRKFLGIKSNIEMLYLSDEIFKQKNKTINIVFGKPISYLKFDKTKSDQKWAEIVKKEAYSLAKFITI